MKMHNQQETQHKSQHPQRTFRYSLSIFHDLSKKEDSSLDEWQTNEEKLSYKLRDIWIQEIWVTRTTTTNINKPKLLSHVNSFKALFLSTMIRENVVLQCWFVEGICRRWLGVQQPKKRNEKRLSKIRTNERVVGLEEDTVWYRNEYWKLFVEHKRVSGLDPIHKSCEISDWLSKRRKDLIITK
jgi:uncharacterized protein YifE (UPF0438 family)